MKVYAQKLLVCFFLGLFSFLFSQSIQKYIRGETSYRSDYVDIEKIQYPSISVCKKYTFEGTITSKNLFTNISLADKKKIALDNIWNKSEVFHFVNHPGMFRMTYPCLTTNDGTDPGKPCYFPFR